MAALGYNADPNDLPEKGGDFPLFPAGDVPMQAVNCEITDTKKGGKMAVWEFNVTSGPFEGRKHWERVVIQNPPGVHPEPGKDAAVIGQRKNNQFAAAIGLIGEAASDTDNYLFQAVICTMKVRPAKGEYGPSNEIGAFKPASGGNAPRASAAGNGAERQTATTNTGGTATTNTAPTASPSNGKPNATKAPDSKWYDDDGNVVPVFKLSGYNKVGG